jgi:oxygen-independent coproporphyrinogen-3 oxidase
MQGIYIHIPFCRQACRYCDFFFSVSRGYMDEYVDRLVEELDRRSEEASGNLLNTLYLGGGTPSLLSATQMDKLTRVILGKYRFRKDPEWTVECNPDDLDDQKLEQLQKSGFKRLSIGVQSFQERDLELMRRSHNAHQAEDAVRRAAGAGFKNITIDLIYGIPGQSLAEWEENIRRALALPVQHISAYHLTFEAGTPFDHWRKKGRLSPLEEEESVRQYLLLREKLLAEGFDHYELSNFSRDGFRSEHNMIYWSGQAYMGLGAAAHSFDGKQRSWNMSSLKGYIAGIAAGKGVAEEETISPVEGYHDYLITSLRTSRGANPRVIGENYGPLLRKHFERKAEAFLASGHLVDKGNHLVIDPTHWLVMDHILRALFWDQDPDAIPARPIS